MALFLSLIVILIGWRLVLKAHRFIVDNKQETTRIMTRWLSQSPEAASRSYEMALLTLSRNGEIAMLHYLGKERGEKFFRSLAQQKIQWRRGPFVPNDRPFPGDA